MNNDKSYSKCKSKTFFVFKLITETNSENLKLKLKCISFNHFEIGLQFWLVAVPREDL